MKYGMNILAIMAVILVFIGTIQMQPHALQGQFEVESTSNSQTSARNSSCDPSINISLQTTTFTPSRKIPLEVELSCMDFKSIYDDNDDGFMDFDLRVRLFQNGAAGNEPIWFANQNSKDCVAYSCVYWDFNLNSTNFVEVFYLNGSINNDAENDDELWPPRDNNLTPNQNYTAVVSLNSMNQYFSMNRSIGFSIIPASNSKQCSPLLKTFTTNSSTSTPTVPLETGNFYRFSDTLYNNLELTCLDQSDSYDVLWRITEWQSGNELDRGWWNVTGVENAQTSITRLASDLFQDDGSSKYAISGSVSILHGSTMGYYPNPGYNYSYGGFWINISDIDDDLIEDPNDNCISIQNPYQLDFDSDQIGDVCDSDIDDDNVNNSVPFDGTGPDKCPYENASQKDYDSDGCLDEVELLDSDNDSIPDIYDAYPYTSYTEDYDNDTIDNYDDNCPLTSNFHQTDMDGDDVGDVCDYDIDGDEVNNSIPVVLSNFTNLDQCPFTAVNSTNDVDANGCVDEPEIIECPVCNQTQTVATEPVETEPIIAESNETAILDPEDIPTVAAIGGAGAFGGGLAAVGIRKLRQGARYIGVDDGLDMLKHLPKRKKADSGSDHYFQKGRIRQEEMTKSADKLLDDYIEDSEGGSSKKKMQKAKPNGKKK